MKVLKNHYIKCSLAAAVSILMTFSIRAEEKDNFSIKASPDKVIQNLKSGNERFVEGKSTHPNASIERLKLAGTQSQSKYAVATILACSDSRVPVELIFDAGVMDLFIVRVAGNVCNTDEIGSIEYGLCHVNTPLLVILGHSQCGAVTAVANAEQGHGHKLEKNIPPLVSSIVPPVKSTIAKNPDKHGEELVELCVEENVWKAIENLFMNSAATRNIVKSGKVKVVGAIYDVSSGKVNWLPQDKVMKILETADKNPARSISAVAE